MSGPGSGRPTDERDRNGGRDSSSDDRSGDAPRTVSRQPNPAREATENVSIEDDGLLRWFLKTNNETIAAIRDAATGVAIVAFIGLLLFGISGVWPPLVAVESGSMEPNMERGDLVFVADENRFVGDGSAGDTGIVTLQNGAVNGHEKLGGPGDVIVFKPDGREDRTPIIHRAHFWVEEGERWVETKANPDYLNGAETCEQVHTCPAEHAGFVTKGDANPTYDQISSTRSATSDVVKPEWIVGKSQFRIPWLGHVRLTLEGLLTTEPLEIEYGLDTTVGSSGASPAPTPMGGTVSILERPSAVVTGVGAIGVSSLSVLLTGRW